MNHNNSGTEKVRRRVYKSDGHISGSFSIQRTVQSFQQWELLWFLPLFWILSHAVLPGGRMVSVLRRGQEPPEHQWSDGHPSWLFQYRTGWKTGTGRPGRSGYASFLVLSYYTRERKVKRCWNKYFVDLQASHGHQSGFLERTTPVYALLGKHLKKIKAIGMCTEIRYIGNIIYKKYFYGSKTILLPQKQSDGCPAIYLAHYLVID